MNTYGGEAKRLLEDLQQRNERLFLVTALFMNTARTKQELDNGIFQTAGIAQKYNCSLRRLDYMQEQGLMSSVPLGLNLIPIQRALTTTSTAIFVPFTTQELFMPGESLYYGLNALSNNMIMVDRKKLTLTGLSSVRPAPENRSRQRGRSPTPFSPHRTTSSSGTRKGSTIPL